MQTVLDEIVEKVSSLTSAERYELIQLLQEEQNKEKQKISKGYVSLNVIWLKKNAHKFAGNYVALKDGELVAVGKTIREANEKAKEKGAVKPLLHYIPAEDEEIWAGW